MPVIQLRNNGLDGTWIQALMHFPLDVERRDAFYAIQYLRAQIDGTPADELITIDRQTLNAVLDAPAYADMLKLLRASSKRGSVAGDFLVSIFAMDAFSNDFAEPSVRKAVVVAKAFARHTQFGDESPLPRSDRAIRQCFNDNRTVAHLWGAFRLHHAFPIRDHREIFSSDAAVRQFLGIARTLQDFGCGFIPKRARPKVPLLEADSVWRVPDGIPKLIPPWTSPPTFLLGALKRYRVRRDCSTPSGSN